MKAKSLIILIVIVVLAIFVRTYNLDSIPYGFHIDEAKVGWNAFSILQTGRDDKGNFLPGYYNSFGDFRPAGLIYLIIPSLIIFGKTVFAVRFPFAVFGALTVVPLFLFTKVVFKAKNSRTPLVAASLLAFNPWHIIASRSTSESVMAIFLTMWGLYFFVKLYKSNKLIDAFLSFISFLVSYLFYHNIRILAPLFLIVVAFYDQVVLDNKKNIRQLGVIIALIIASVLVFMSPESRGRMSQVNLKSDFQVLYEVTKMPTEEGPGHVFTARLFHNKAAAYIRRFCEEYKDYFSTNFLVGNSSKPIRYSVPQVGLLTYFELLFFIFGLFAVSRKPELLIILTLLVLAPIPGAVTIEDVPNMQRSIFLIPFLIIIASCGVDNLFKFGNKWRWLLILFGLGYLANFGYFWHMYLSHQKMSIATYFRNGGNVELVSKLGEIKNNYRKIILTNSPDDLYPWIAFGMFDNAHDFNLSYSMTKDIREYDKFVFSKDKCPTQRFIENKAIPNKTDLFVDAEGCTINTTSTMGYIVSDIEIIKRPDGSPPYYLRSIRLKE